MHHGKGKHRLWIGVAAGMALMYLTSIFGPAGFAWECAPLRGTVAAENEDESENSVIELTLEKARDRMVDESREIKRLEYEIKKMEEEKENLKEIRDDLKEERDELENLASSTDTGASRVVQEQAPTRLVELEGNDNNDNESLENDLEEVMEEMMEEMMEGMMEEMQDMMEELMDALDLEGQLDDAIEETEEGIRQIDHGLEMLEMQKEQEVEQQKYNAKEYYASLLSLKNQKETMQENLDNLETAIQEEKKKQELGESTGLAVDGIKIGKMELENGYQTLQSGYRTQEMRFLDELGYSPDKSIKLKDDISFDLHEFKESYDYEKALEKLLEDGHQMEMVRKQVEFAEENLAEASSEEEEIKRIELKEAELDKEEAQQNLPVLLYTTWSSFEEESRNYQINSKDLSFHKELLRGEELQKEHGMSTSARLAEAVAEKNQVKRNLVQSEYDAYLLAQQLKLLEEGHLVEMAAGAPENGMDAPAEAPDQQQEEPDMDMDMDPGGAPETAPGPGSGPGAEPDPGTGQEPGGN